MATELTDDAVEDVAQLRDTDRSSTPAGRVRQAADAIATGATVAGQKAKEAARATGEAAGKAAVLLGDLNGDGKLDEQDARIAAEKVRGVASKKADEAGGILKEIIKHDVFKDVIAFAVIGALIAIPLPLVGPIGGAAAGAIGGLVKNILTPRKK